MQGKWQSIPASIAGDEFEGLFGVDGRLLAEVHKQGNLVVACSIDDNRSERFLEFEQATTWIDNYNPKL